MLHFIIYTGYLTLEEANGKNINRTWFLTIFMVHLEKS